jgi:hypothetical protein
MRRGGRRGVREGDSGYAEARRKAREHHGNVELAKGDGERGLDGQK